MKLRSRVNDGFEMPFLDHLEELRWRALWSLIALAVGAVVGFTLVTRFDVLHLLILPVLPYLDGDKLRYLSPADPFFLTLKLGLTVGGLLASPVVIYQVWAFLAPALRRDERRAIVPAFYLGLVLFAGGVALGYYAALPATLRFMMGFQRESLSPMITAGPYLGFVMKMLLAFGAVFELPVIILVLAVVGLVDSRMLRRQRRFAIVLSTVVAAIITPGDMIVLTVFIMVPLILLYELSIGLTVLVERRRRRAGERQTLVEA